MIPGLELSACQPLAMPAEVMEHVVRVESSFNPWAIGVVGARLERQPRDLGEAIATVRALARAGYDFSIGLAQINRRNLVAQGLDSWEAAFDPCRNLAAGARILADCVARGGGDLDRGLSCYYSGNFTRGFRDGYVDRVRRSMAVAATAPGGRAKRRPPAIAGTSARGLNPAAAPRATWTSAPTPAPTPASPPAPDPAFVF